MARLSRLSSTMQQEENSINQPCVLCEQEQATAAKALSFDHDSTSIGKDCTVTVDPDGFLRPAPLTLPQHSRFKVLFLCSLSALFFLLGIFLTWVVIRLVDSPTDEFHAICHFPKFEGNVHFGGGPHKMFMDKPKNLMEMGSYFLFKSDTCSNYTSSRTMSGRDLNPFAKVNDDADLVAIGTFSVNPGLVFNSESAWKVEMSNEIDIKPGDVLRLSRYHGRDHSDCCVVESNPVEIIEKVTGG